MGKNKKAAYICRQDQSCCDNKHCAKNGGDCMYTTRVDHAANFELAEDGSGYWIEKSKR